MNEIHDNHEHASTSLKVILLVFAIVLVGTLGYLVWDFNRTADTTDYSTPVAKKKTETTNTTTATSTDGTEDWKTYANTQYEFSYKYPSDWTAREQTPPNTMSEPWKSYLFYSSYTPPSASDHYGYVAVSTKSADALIAVEFPNNTNIVKETVDIAGTTAVKATVTTATGNIATSYYISKNDYTFIVTGPITDPQDDQASKDYWKQVDKIVTTFNFTN